jgi:ABC-2 type transport system ATP-binding protein
LTRTEKEVFLIEVHELTKYYGLKPALKKVSFTVNKGEILGFLGPNGAGKSTLMKIITCYLSPTKGTVKIDGLDVFEDSLEVRKRIGYLPEHPPIYLDMIVKDYLTFVAKIKGVDPKRIKERIEYVIEKCGLERYYKSTCNSLSKGYRQRVGIAQAVIHNPMVLILDEPTIGLDPIQIVEIRELIKSFGGEHTVILSTHILSEVDMTCERVIIINEGILITEDSTSNLRNRITKTRQFSLRVRGDVSALLPKINALEGIISVNEEKADEAITLYHIDSSAKTDIRPTVARIVINDNLELLEMKDYSMTLEEVFIKVTMK